MRRLLSGRDQLRPGVLKHVTLHSAMESRMSGAGTQHVREELEAAGYSGELNRATVRALRRLLAGLSWRPDPSHWADYQQTSTYTEQERAAKAAFVDQALAGGRLGLVWDLGCNDGTYSKLCAAEGAYVVATDADHAVIDRLAREENERILPLVVDLADPPPALGWRGAERKHLPARGKPDLTLALALVHHLAITRNVPLAELLDWFAGLEGALVVEFVDPADEMAQRLLAAKREGLHGDYNRGEFERLLGQRFDVARTEELAGGRRVLYLAHPRT